MRANITTARSSPVMRRRDGTLVAGGDSSSFYVKSPWCRWLAVVGMMVGGAGPLGGFREKNIPWHFRHQRQPSWPPGMPVTHQRQNSGRADSRRAGLCRGKLPERGFPSPHIQFT